MNRENWFGLLELGEHRTQLVISNNKINLITLNRSVTVTPGLLEYSSGDTLDYVEPCLPCASVSVETHCPSVSSETVNPEYPIRHTFHARRSLKEPLPRSRRDAEECYGLCM